MRVFFLLLVSTAGMVLAGSADAKSTPQLLNLQEMVTADDYPAIAAKNGQEGTTIVSVRVSREGLVESCKIKKSSGHVVLDEQSCAVFRARAQFEPARDDSGRAIEGIYEREMTWRLEGAAPIPLPRQAWMSKGTLRVGNDKVIDCLSEYVGLTEPLDICPQETASEQSSSEIVVGEIITIFHFVPASYDRAKIPPNLTDATLVGQQISEITIDPDGVISRCEAARYVGRASPTADSCAGIVSHRFAPVAPGSPEQKGTVVTTEYIRKRANT